MPIELWGAVATGGIFLLGQVWAMASLVGRVKTIEKNSTAFLEVVRVDHDRVISLEVKAETRDRTSQEFRETVAKSLDKMDATLDNLRSK